NVTNMLLDEAVSLLDSVCLEAVPIAEENSGVEPNIVWAQDPPLGENLKEGDTVRVIYNPSNAPIPVPDLTGLDLEQARKALLNNGLTIGEVTYVNDPEIAEGIIISSTPAFGDSVLGGATIDLTVSQGKGTNPMPVLDGKTIEEARSILEGAPYKFTVNEIIEASDTIEIGYVIRTSPITGAETPIGATVTVYVSNGRAPIKAPPVVGLTEAQARAQLTAKGFTVKVNYVSVEADSPDAGRVISQDPRSGVEAEVGSQVVLEVGRATSSTTSQPPASDAPGA
ncbi:MAG: PASTA domain-containing protein, partial [Hylemonella sp.]